MTFGRNLDRLLADREMKPKHLVDAGFDGAQVSRWLNDQVLPDLRSVLRLSAALKVPASTLIAGINPEYDAMLATIAVPARLLETWQSAAQRRPGALGFLWRSVQELAGVTPDPPDDTPQAPPASESDLPRL